MVHVDKLPEAARARIVDQKLPEFGAAPWAEGPDLSQRRVAIVSTAGLHRRDDRPFGDMSADYRLIPDGVDTDDLVMSHISTNFDRTGFQKDINVVFPIDRLRELAGGGVIGGIAAYHYSFMGATPPDRLEAAARELAGILLGDKVTAVVLVPV